MKDYYTFITLGGTMITVVLFDDVNKKLETYCVVVTFLIWGIY